jgi:putative ABC transport system permease protein
VRAVHFAFELWESLLIALRAIRVNKMRAALTTLGIIIGILAVTLMATVVNGIERDFEQNMEQLGADVVYIEKWPWSGGPGFKWWNYINRPNMTADLADVVEQRSRYAQAATPVVRTGRPVAYGRQTLYGVGLIGTRPNYPVIHPLNLESGRFFNEYDNRSAQAVCVIGSEVADYLFPVEEPLGKNIRVGDHRFRVIGVMERKGSGAEGTDSRDRDIYMPYNAFKKAFGMRWRDVSVQVKLAGGIAMEEATDELTGILRVARKLDAKEDNDFEINEQQSLREQIAPVKTAIYSIGIGLTALALLVGGIGVMNIMFVSVKERTREIGIRKAVGASRRTILIQFLVEAVVVCFVGGLLGVLISLPLVMLIQTVLPAYLGTTTVAVAFSICVFIGVVFGLAPAWTAAKAEPIDALRYE